MPNPAALPTWPRGMRIDVAATYVGISPSLLVAEVRAARFPAAVRLTAGRVVWLKEDIDAWLDAKAGRAEASPRRPADPDPPNEWDIALSGDRAA